jgi:SAM-dependent methyltransferase
MTTADSAFEASLPQNPHLPTNRSVEKCVQFGCGLSCPSGWVNFDSSPRLRLQRLPLVGSWAPAGPFGRFPVAVRYGDIVKGLPLPDGSVRLLYCSHVLEHLSLQDLRRALRNCNRLMATGGIFRLVLPDLEALINDYVVSRGVTRAEDFIRSTLMGVEDRDTSLKGLLEMFLGNARHLWLWDYAGLSHELQAAGFIDIRRAHFGDSGITEFSAVESPDRWVNALGIQCSR